MTVCVICVCVRVICVLCVCVLCVGVLYIHDCMCDMCVCACYMCAVCARSPTKLLPVDSCLLNFMDVIPSTSLPTAAVMSSFPP